MRRPREPRAVSGRHSAKTGQSSSRLAVRCNVAEPAPRSRGPAATTYTFLFPFRPIHRTPNAISHGGLPMLRIQSSTSLPSLHTVSGAADRAGTVEPAQGLPFRPSSESDIGHFEASLEGVAEPDTHGIPGTVAHILLGGVARLLDANNGDAMSQIPRESQELAISLAELAEHGIDRENHRLQPGTAEHTVIQRATAFVQARQQDQGGTPLTAGERCIAVMDFVGRIFANDFEEDSWRWVANVCNTAIRTGLIVGMTTTLRQLVGFSLEKALQLGDAPMPVREAMGIAAMLIGPALNVAGFVRDEVRGTATAQSELARIAMFTLSIGALIAVSKTGDPSTLGASMSSTGVQVLTYTMARDLAQLFVPLHSNAPINLGGSIAAGLIYGGVQFGVAEAMDAWGSDSGVQRVTMAADAAAHSSENAERMADWFTSELHSTSDNLSDSDSIRSRVTSALNALGPNLPQAAICGVINALGECIDELALGGISRALHVRQQQATIRREAQAEGRDPGAAVDELSRQDTEGLRLRLGLRWPSRTQAASQMLTTNAMRTEAFIKIGSVAGMVSESLARTNLPPGTQRHLVNSVIAGSAVTIYPPFVFAHRQREPLASEAADAAPKDRGLSEGSELRRRRIVMPTPPATKPTPHAMRRSADSAPTAAKPAVWQTGKR